MKKNKERAIALGLTVALLISCAGCGAADSGASNSEETTVAGEGITVSETEAEPISAMAVSSEKDEKDTDNINDADDLDDMVYVLAGADGTVQKIIVGDLDQKESRTELPVELKVSYQLDGKAISPQDLAGKSGKVTIRFDYTNTQYEMVEIDGKEEKIYVPFAMMTGLLLDTEHFRNVTVSNGKMVNDGSHLAVVGIAFPGLAENLGISKDEADTAEKTGVAKDESSHKTAENLSDEIEIPDYVEITADVDSFELGNTVTIAANDLFCDMDSDKLDYEEELKGTAGDLSSAMQQLMDGSSSLYDGLYTLLGKSSELIAGVGSLADGILDLKNGAAYLDQGAGSLAGGTSTLTLGLGQLELNSASLNAGAKAVFEALLGTASAKLGEAGIPVSELTIENYGETLEGILASLTPEVILQKAEATAREKIRTEVENNRDAIVAGVTAAVREQVTAGVTAAVRGEVQSQVEAAVGTGVKSKVEAAVRADVEKRVKSVVQAAVESQVKAAVGTEVEREVQNAVRESIKTQVTSQVAAAVKAGVLAAAGFTEESYEAGIADGVISPEQQAAIETAVESQMASEEVQSQILSAVETQVNSEEVQTAIAQTVTDQLASEEVQTTIEAAVEVQMASEEVQTTIAQGVEAQMTSEEVQTVISQTVSDQLSSEEVQTTISQTVEAKMASEDIQKTIEENMEAKMASEEIQKTISEKTDEQINNLIETNFQSEAVQQQIKDGIKEASEGVQSIQALKTQLDNYNLFYSGLGQYTAGVSSANLGAIQIQIGAAQLKSGTSALATGAGALYRGVLTLKNGMPALAEGVTALTGGSLQLSEGLTTFNSQAIEKLVDMLGGDLSQLAVRLRATIDVSHAYSSRNEGTQTGSNSQATGNNSKTTACQSGSPTRFVYRTDEIR